MFTPGIKYGIRIGLIAVITGLILAIFVGVQIPVIDFTPITKGLGSVFALLTHFIPVYAVIIPLMISLLTVRLALYVWKVGSIAVKWIWKVNE